MPLKTSEGIPRLFGGIRLYLVGFWATLPFSPKMYVFIQTVAALGRCCCFGRVWESLAQLCIQLSYRVLSQSCRYGPRIEAEKQGFSRIDLGTTRAMFNMVATQAFAWRG